jgi:NAD(P)-dependent dehydrogenase (short-subunit alcohol dehydrogenase family)
MTGELMTNHIALVTGAAHGIGFEVVRQLAKRDMLVILTARDTQKGNAAAQQFVSEGLHVIFRQLDVTDSVGLLRLVLDFDREFGKLDILVNNAAGSASWTETPSTANLDDAHAVIETTLFGAWRTIQAFLPLIRKGQHGRIVNVSSGAGSHGDPQFGLEATGSSAPGYGVSKAALNALTVKFAAELRETGILVNAVCPGLTATFPGAEAMGARPIPEGAAGIVWAATLPDDGPTGGFFRDGKPLAW